MFLSRLIQKLSGTRRKEIPLNLLSRLWIEKEMTGKATLQNSTTNQWAHEDINQFHAQYIAPNMAVLGPAALFIDRILTLLDDAGDCLSCVNDPDEEKMPTGITLREHSLTVAKIAVAMIKKAHRDYEMILGKILIICLGHGLGALSQANTIGGMPAKTLLILDPMIQDLPFKQDIVLAILTSCENHPKTDGARILKAACLAARKNEVERAKVISGIGHPDILNPDVLDIDKIRAAIHLPEGK